MKCKYCKKEIGDRDQEECMLNPCRTYGDSDTDIRNKQIIGPMKEEKQQVDGFVMCDDCGEKKAKGTFVYEFPKNMITKKLCLECYKPGFVVYAPIGKRT